MRYMLADNAAAIFCGGSMISNQAVSLSKQPMECIRDCNFIRDVERGAELSFSGPLRGPLHHRQILFSDRRTDGRTDAINIFWAFLQ